MNFMGHSRTSSINDKKYAFVIADDHYHFTWVIFFSHKDEALNFFEAFCKKVQLERCYYIPTIRNDHGGIFKRNDFDAFCNEHGITHNFSSPRSP